MKEKSLKQIFCFLNLRYISPNGKRGNGTNAYSLIFQRSKKEKRLIVSLKKSSLTNKLNVF